jgi:parallel beta-helix repeat protein
MRLKYLLGFLPVLLMSCEAPKGVPYEIYKIKKSGTEINCEGREFNDGKVTEIRISASNVTINNCKINGSIRTVGLGMNGEDEAVKESSHSEGHTERLQKAAPSYVQITNSEIKSYNRIPVYFGPGTTRSSLIKTKITGTTDSVVVYLDAESGYNIINDNTFDVSGNFTLRQFRIREVIAVDGSANNYITNNNFETATGGGIYLYRNCGEGGTVRHQAPQGNIIDDNVFNLNGLIINNYGIWLGARNGNRFYCNADDGYQFGSSKDDGDFADNNSLGRNKFVGSDNTIKDSGKNNTIF